MTCWWLVYDLWCLLMACVVMICNDLLMTWWWLVDDLLMTCWWLVDDLWWLVDDLLVTCWWLVGDLFDNLLMACLTTCWWLVVTCRRFKNTSQVNSLFYISTYYMKTLQWLIYISVHKSINLQFLCQYTVSKVRFDYMFVILSILCALKPSDFDKF